MQVSKVHVVVGDSRGTHYRIIVVALDESTLLIALPDFHWSIDLQRYRPPDAGWLAEHRLKPADARAVADLLKGNWQAFSEDKT